MSQAGNPHERRAQLAIAASSTAIGESGTDAVVRWIAALPSEDVVELGANVRGDLRSFTAHATADVPHLFEQLDILLEGSGDPDEDREQLQQLGNALAPSRLGTWLTATQSDGETTLDAGWTFHGEFVLPALASYLPESEAVSKVFAWARDHGVATCPAIARSLGEDNPFFEITLAIPQPKAVEDLLAATDAKLPPSLIKAAGDPTRVRSARIAFTDEGISRVALRFSAPARSTLLTLVDKGHDRALATIDAALADESPAALDLVATAAGPSVEIVYAVETLTVADD